MKEEKYIIPVADRESGKVTIETVGGKYEAEIAIQSLGTVRVTAPSAAAANELAEIALKKFKKIKKENE
jgi:tRNA(Met) C34 N-acetyltransferase TmcA